MAKTWQKHDKNMARALQNSLQEHGKDMARAWQRHGKSMARAWQKHGNNMAKTWQEHGKDATTAWQKHGKSMAKTLGESLYTLCRRSRNLGYPRSWNRKSFLRLSGYFGSGICVRAHGRIFWNLDTVWLFFSLVKTRNPGHPPRSCNRKSFLSLSGCSGREICVRAHGRISCNLGTVRLFFTHVKKLRTSDLLARGRVGAKQFPSGIADSRTGWDVGHFCIGT